MVLKNKQLEETALLELYGISFGLRKSRTGSIGIPLTFPLSLQKRCATLTALLTVCALTRSCTSRIKSCFSRSSKSSCVCSSLIEHENNIIAGRHLQDRTKPFKPSRHSLKASSAWMCPSTHNFSTAERLMATISAGSSFNLSCDQKAKQATNKTSGRGRFRRKPRLYRTSPR